MREHVRSEDQEVEREICDPEVDKIGSRVFPLRGTPPSMPSVGTRRSTRVFVRKNVTKVAPDGNSATRVLRSGKRLSLSKSARNQVLGDEDKSSYDWMELFGSSAESEDADWWKATRAGYVPRKGNKEGQRGKCEYGAEEALPKLGSVAPEDLPRELVLTEESEISLPSGKLFGISYSRKRRRSLADPRSGSNGFKAIWSSLFDRSVPLSFSSGRNGIAELGNHGKKRRTSIIEKGLEITGTARRFAEMFLIPDKCVWFGSRNPVALVLLIHSARSSSLERFSSLLLSILTGMMSGGASLPDCSSFLSSRPAVCLFSFSDIDFLPLQMWNPEFHHRIASDGSGFCILFRPQMLIPRVSVNFSALPCLFKRWHFSIFYHLLYLPSCAARYDYDRCTQTPSEFSVEEHRLHEYQLRAKNTASEREISSSGISASMDNAPVSLTSEESSCTVRSLARVNALKFRQRGRKRSLLRNGSRSSLTRSRRSKFVGIKVHPVEESPESGTISEKAHDSSLVESGGDDYTLPSPTSVNQKRRRFSAKNSMKRMKGSKSVSSEAKQKVDGLACSANLLIIGDDRCWRENGAVITLELLSSNEWCIVVKLGNSTRFVHKAQEMKPSSSNRFTHAMIWSGENGWKLEFFHKNDWNVFKELHKECVERNFQGIPTKIVPIPGVRDVPDYEERCPSCFERPESYIRVRNDEIERLLMSEKAFYDMDSGDEEWLGGQSSLVSEDDFEKMISSFEKHAYSHPDEDATDQGRAVSLSTQFGSGGKDVYDYWVKKRRQKHSPLIRAFQQGQPPARKRQPQQALQKPHLRKKRSFKRQSSQSGRGGSLDIFFEAAAKQEAVERLQTAEAAIGKHAEAAVRLRSKAQELMVNADLAVYKAVMAVKLAEAIQEGSDPGGVCVASCP